MWKIGIRNQNICEKDHSIIDHETTKIYQKNGSNSTTAPNKSVSFYKHFYKIIIFILNYTYQKRQEIILTSIVLQHNYFKFFPFLIKMN